MSNTTITHKGSEYKPYQPVTPTGNYKVREYKGGGSYIKFGLKDGRNKAPDDAAARKKKAQIYGEYKDPLRNKVHDYKRVHSYKQKEFEATPEKYGYLYFGKKNKTSLEK